MDMNLVRGTNSGAKTILAYFHYCSKGQTPFREDFDWNSPKLPKMAQLDDDQRKIMIRYQDQVVQRGE